MAFPGKKSGCIFAGFDRLPERIKLPDSFIEHYTRGGRQIQASRFLSHGNGQAMIGIRGEKAFGQTLGFTPKYEMIAPPELLGPIGPVHFLRQKQESGAARFLTQGFERGPSVHVTLIPIVHAGPAQRLLLERKPQRLEKMEPRACGKAQAGDVTGVRRDFGFYQYDMEHPRQNKPNRAQ
jgi:hypothetical protein